MNQLGGPSGLTHKSGRWCRCWLLGCWLEHLSSFPCGFSFSIRLDWPPHVRISGQCSKQAAAAMHVRPRFQSSHVTSAAFCVSTQIPRPTQIQGGKRKWAPHLSRRSSKVTWQIHTRMGGLCGHRTNNHVVIVRIIELVPCQHLSQSDLCFRMISLVDCTYWVKKARD